MDFTPVSTEFQKATRIRGVISQVARRLNLSHEHVRQVALGGRESARVAKALASEMRKRQAKAAESTKVPTRADSGKAAA